MTVIVKQAGRFSETTIDDEIVVMRLDNGEFYSLTGTGAAIWRMIDGTRGRAELIDALAQEFLGDRQQIGMEAEQFLGELEEAGLIAEA